MGRERVRREVGRERCVLCISQQDIPDVLERIQVFRVFSIFDLLALVHSLGQRIAQQVCDNARLTIRDYVAEVTSLL